MEARSEPGSTVSRESDLWRASFLAPPEAMPELLEALEELARAVSIFEHEVDADQETASWRVELLLDRRPEPKELRSRLRPLCAPFGFRPEAIAVDRVTEEDWLAAVRTPVAPVLVGRFAVHGEAAAAALPPDLVPIRIEAGLAFGTGEHATTSGCLEAIELLARRRRFHRVLDLGCGSGVLAIAAAKCWPCRVVAADIDPVAVRVAGENVLVNGVADRVRCVTSDGLAHWRIRRSGPFDLIFANILADPVCALAAPIARALAPGGRVVLSGFLDRQAEQVARTYVCHGMRQRRRIEKHPWVALILG